MRDSYLELVAKSPQVDAAIDSFLQRAQQHGETLERQKGIERKVIMPGHDAVFCYEGREYKLRDNSSELIVKGKYDYKSEQRQYEIQDAQIFDFKRGASLAVDMDTRSKASLEKEVGMAETVANLRALGMNNHKQCKEQGVLTSLDQFSTYKIKVSAEYVRDTPR